MTTQTSKLTIHDFLNQPAIQEVAKLAKNFREKGIVISDLVDSENNQYVDLVQEGGGMLGIALVGYTWAMEEAGIRFFNLAGTSAGAINTLLCASLGTVQDRKSTKILDYLCQKNMFEFVDGDEKVKRLIQAAIDGKRSWVLVYSLLSAFRILKEIKSRLGLNPGKNFYQWITEILKKNNISTTKQLMELHEKLPTGFHHRGMEPVDDLRPKLAIVTAELNTQSKICFPEMAQLYWENPGEVNPSDFARASMSVPIFFEPFRVNNIPNDEKAKERWTNLVSFNGPIPVTATFVDGGLLSNFPINLFHNINRVPRMPTFGVRLSAYRESLNETDKILGFFGAMINTMRQIYDFDFLFRNPDYKQLICRLDTDKDFSWLDFNMTDSNKLKLFEKGAVGAMDFLTNFKWKEYKDLRESLIPKPAEITV